jgi:hypothetical protein
VDDLTTYPSKTTELALVSYRSAFRAPHDIFELSQLESAVRLFNSLQAQHAAVQSISALESKVTSLETLVRTFQLQDQVQVRSLSPAVQSSTNPIPPDSNIPAPSRPMVTEHERLPFTHKEWESEVKNVDANLGTANAKFDATDILHMSSNRSHYSVL